MGTLRWRYGVVAYSFVPLEMLLSYSQPSDGAQGNIWRGNLDKFTKGVSLFFVIKKYYKQSFCFAIWFIVESDIVRVGHENPVVNWLTFEMVWVFIKCDFLLMLLWLIFRGDSESIKHSRCIYPSILKPQSIVNDSDNIIVPLSCKEKQRVSNSELQPSQLHLRVSYFEASSFIIMYSLEKIT